MYSRIPSNESESAKNLTIKSERKSLILLATGRCRDLVEWELKNQCSYSGVPLVAFSALLVRFESDGCRLSCDGKINGTTDTSSSAAAAVKQRKIFNEVLFKAEFDCSDHPDHVLKSVIANCILLRCAYEEVVSYAVGTEQLWKNLQASI